MSEIEAPLRLNRSPSKIAGEPGFVLHATAYKETSLVVQAFTRHHGRVAMIAKGAKRPHSALRNALTSLQPLTLDWTGKGEVKTLTSAQWVGGQPPLRGRALVCGFYLNELVLQLLAREDPHEALFDSYVGSMLRLSTGEPHEAVLRAFERTLLEATGVGPQWTVCHDGEPVVTNARYRCIPEHGVRKSADHEGGDWPTVSGQTLLDIQRDDFSDPHSAQQSKLVMRSLINHALAGRPVNTRQILVDLHSL